MVFPVLVRRHHYEMAAWSLWYHWTWHIIGQKVKVTQTRKPIIIILLTGHTWYCHFSHILSCEFSFNSTKFPYLSLCKCHSVDGFSRYFDVSITFVNVGTEPLIYSDPCLSYGCYLHNAWCLYMPGQERPSWLHDSQHITDGNMIS